MSIEFDEAVLGKRRRGPDLYYSSAMPSVGLKAILGILPGLADHGARYRHMMTALAEQGIGSVVIDLRGHGRARGPRGSCTRFDEFVDDAQELRRLVDQRAKGSNWRDRESSAPTFLFGHSFGGLVALSSVLASPGAVRGLVLSAPFFGLGLKPSRWQLLGYRVASRVYPRFALPSGLAGNRMTHDTERAHLYDTDPLVFKHVTARWFMEVAAAQSRARAAVPRLALPLFVTYGTADNVVDLGAIRWFFDAAGSAYKTWDPREGLYHEVHQEPSWRDSVDAIARFVVTNAGGDRSGKRPRVGYDC